MNQILVSTIMTFLLVLVFGCQSGNDEPGPTQDPTPELTLEDLRVTAIKGIDVSNHGNASDIGVVFNSPHTQVQKFKILVLKNGSSIDEQTVETLSTDQFFQLDNGEEQFKVTLPPELKDVDGDNILENNTYQIRILSISLTGDILSEPSNSFTLIPSRQGVTTLPISYSKGDGLDGIAIDSHGNLYVSNFGFEDGVQGNGSELYQIDKFAERIALSSRLNTPSGCTVGPDNIVYVNDSGSIKAISPSGESSQYAKYDEGFAGLVMDENGILYSGGYSHNKLLRIDIDGTVDVLAEDSRLTGTVGIAYHQASQTLFAANFNTGKIMKVNMAGEVSELAQVGGIGYITEMNGHLYATGFHEHKIHQITLEGDVRTIAGSGSTGQKDGDLLEATFNKPNGIVGDAENNILYVTDWGSPRISQIQL